MKLTITLNLNNDAFVDNAGAEIERILSVIGESINSAPVSDGSPESLEDAIRQTQSVFDYNGNRVGSYKISED